MQRLVKTILAIMKFCCPRQLNITSGYPFMTGIPILLICRIEA